MNKFLKWTSLILMAGSLSACYIVPIRDRGYHGYHGGYERHHDGDRRDYREGRR